MVHRTPEDAGDSGGRGVLVLGMHRSGTSVVSGILHRLGLNGGPREQMVEADAFNSDGYWELGPLVELNDVLLRRRGGFASAPPASDRREERMREVHTAGITELMTMLPQPWFMKDPRQCLVLPEWNKAIGTKDPAILVFRRPHDVIRSLRHRNGYSEALAAGLWETYARTLLLNICERPCHVVHYDDLLADPLEVTRALASTLERTGILPRSEDRIEHASGLVRSPLDASSSSSTQATRSIAPAQQPLNQFVDNLRGFSPRLDIDGLPPTSGVGEPELKWRRRRLRLASMIVPSNPALRAVLDRRRGTRFRS